MQELYKPRGLLKPRLNMRLKHQTPAHNRVF